MKIRNIIKDRNFQFSMLASLLLLMIGIITHFITPTYDGPVIFIVIGISFIIILPLCWDGEDEVKEDWLGKGDEE